MDAELNRLIRDRDVLINRARDKGLDVSCDFQHVTVETLTADIDRLRAALKDAFSVLADELAAKLAEEEAADEALRRDEEAALDAAGAPSRAEISQKLADLQAEVLRKIPLPTDYEIRVNALMAAATVNVSSSSTSRDESTVHLAKFFEKYLRGEGR